MRTIIVKIETDSESSFDLIKDDIERELSCCWNWLDPVEISEEVKGESYGLEKKADKGVPSAESRWIPVTERLPEDGAEVWVTTDMLFEVTRARWHEDSNLWCHPYNSECLLALRPIAWMEMSFPEPYKGGEK